MNRHDRRAENDADRARQARQLHGKLAKRAGGSVPDERNLYQLAELFKIFGDLTRIKILNTLFVSEMCVHDLAVLLEMQQPAVSHQLRILKQSGLVRYRKEGKHVFYSLADEHIKQIVDQALEHVTGR